MTYVLPARVLSEMFHLSHLRDYCTALTLSLFFSWTKQLKAFACHIVWKVSLPPATELLFIFFMLCLMKNNLFLLKCRLLLWPKKKKTSLDEFGNGDAALCKWVCEFDYKWYITTVIWNLSRHILEQTKELVRNEGKRRVIRCSFTRTSVFCCTNCAHHLLRTIRDKQSTLPLTLHQLCNKTSRVFMSFLGGIGFIWDAQISIPVSGRVSVPGLRTLVILFSFVFFSFYHFVNFFCTSMELAYCTCSVEKWYWCIPWF